MLREGGYRTSKPRKNGQKLKIEYVNPGELKPAPYNPRQASEKALAALRRGVEEFGFVDPIIVRRRGRLVIGGHQRLKLALEAGLDEVPVIFLGKMTDAETAALNVLLNNPNAQGEWDMGKLVDALGELEAGGFDATLTGFDASQLEQFRIVSGGDPKEVSTPPLPEKAQSQEGKTYELGQHRILCADATEAGTLEKLLGKRRVDLFVTDPPYAIYGSTSGLSADITDDKIVRAFFLETCRLAKATVKKFGHVYIFSDWRGWAAWWEMAKRAELTAKNLLVWDKGAGGLGSNYANFYELIGYFANLPRQKAMSGQEDTGQRPVLKPNLLRFSRATGKERLHNAAKPVPLLAELMENSTDLGETVFDPFVGSGSTLMAAEQTGRICYAIDIEPRWVDVTRQRYADFVGKSELSPTGQLTKIAADG